MMRCKSIVVAFAFGILTVTSATAAAPSNKKVELDLKESIDKAFARDRFVVGLLSVRDVHVLSKENVTEDRAIYKVRIVRQRNSIKLDPRFNAVLGGPGEITSSIAKIPAGTSYVEVTEILYRLKGSEWLADDSKVIERDSREFDAAIELARRR